MVRWLPVVLIEPATLEMYEMTANLRTLSLGTHSVVNFPKIMKYCLSLGH